jgi:hypothetical protein
MKSLLLTILLLSQIEIAQARKYRPEKPKSDSSEATVANNIFEGRSGTLDQSSKNAIDITLPMYGQDPDKGLKEEAASDGIGKCIRSYRYCKVLDNTFRRMSDYNDGSVYGLVLVRGNNNAPEPDTANAPSPTAPANTAICIVIPHKFWTFLGGNYTWYGVSIYYPDTKTKSAEFDADPRGHVGISWDEMMGHISDLKEKGVCGSYRIGSEEDGD